MPCRHKKSLNVTALFSLGKWPISLITENQVSESNIFEFRRAAKVIWLRPLCIKHPWKYVRGSPFAKESYRTVQNWNTVPERLKTRETSTRSRCMPIFH